MMRALEAHNIEARYRGAASTTGAERAKHKQFLDKQKRLAAEWLKAQ